VDFSPVDEAEVFLRFEEWEDLDAEWREDEIGVFDAAEANAGGEEGDESEGGNNPPVEDSRRGVEGVLGENNGNNSDGEAEEESTGCEPVASLCATGEAEFFLWVDDWHFGV